MGTIYGSLVSQFTFRVRVTSGALKSVKQAGPDPSPNGPSGKQLHLGIDDLSYDSESTRRLGNRGAGVPSGVGGTDTATSAGGSGTGFITLFFWFFFCFFA